MLKYDISESPNQMHVVKLVLAKLVEWEKSQLEKGLRHVHMMDINVDVVV